MNENSKEDKQENRTVVKTKGEKRKVKGARGVGILMKNEILSHVHNIHYLLTCQRSKTYRRSSAT